MKNSEIEMQKKCRILPEKVNTKARLGKNLHEIFEFEISQPPFQSYTSSEKKNTLHQILIPDDLKWLYFIIEEQFQKKPHFRNNCVNRCHLGLESVYVSFLISLIFIF